MTTQSLERDNVDFLPFISKAAERFQIQALAG
jgi:hypothetical protein